MSDGGGIALLRNNVETQSNCWKLRRNDDLDQEKASLGADGRVTGASAGQDIQDKRKCLKCGSCGEVFHHLADLSIHLKHVHIRVEAYDCGVCLKFFAGVRELEDHLLQNHLHSDTGNTPPAPTRTLPHIQQADIDNFMDKSELRERVELRCPLCSCIYNKLSLYQQHMSVAHKNKAWDKDGLCSAVLKITSVKSNSVKPVIIPHDPEGKIAGKVYTCGACDKKVFGREPMKRHVGAMHADHEIFQCRACAEFFISRMSYDTHLQTAHLNLDYLNITKNKHGDMIGLTLRDILNANDSLSVSTDTIDPPADSSSDPESSSLIDIDSECIVTRHPYERQEMIPSEGNVEQETPIIKTESTSDVSGSCKFSEKPNWKTHKRERSDDSLPDSDHPFHNLLMLCKAAGRERKRLAVDNPKDEVEDKTSASDRIPSDESFNTTEHAKPQNTSFQLLLDAPFETKATWFLSVHHTLLCLVSLALYYNFSSHGI